MLHFKSLLCLVNSFTCKIYLLEDNDLNYKVYKQRIQLHEKQM